MSVVARVDKYRGASARRISSLFSNEPAAPSVRAASAPPFDTSHDHDTKDNVAGKLKPLTDSSTVHRLNSIHGRNADLPPPDGSGGETNAGFDSISETASISPQHKTTIVSFVIDEEEDYATDDEYNQAKKRCKENESNGVTVLLSVLYTIILILVGTIFPITEALRGYWLADHMVGVYLVYMFTVSSAFLIYLQLEDFLSKRKARHGTHAHHKSAENPKDPKDPSKGDSAMPSVVVLRRRSHATISEDVDPIPSSFEDLPQDTSSVGIPRSPNLQKSRASASTSSEDDIQSESGDSSDLNEEIMERISFQTQTASLSHETASIYLRLGALLFGIGNFVYVSLELEYYVGSRHLISCPRVPMVYPMIFHLIFLVIQTFFILKHTQVHIKKRKGLARFGLMHVLATNLVVWVRILVREIHEGVTHSADEHFYHQPEGLTDASHTNGSSSCADPKSLLSQASPYLFPCVLEYSLIAVAVMAGMFQSISMKVTQDVIEVIRKTLRQRKPVVKKEKESHHHHHEHHEIDSMFDKSHRGIYLGALVLAGAVISIILFFYNLNSLHRTTYARGIFHITDISIHGILFIAVIWAMVRFFKLNFTVSRNNTIDDRLLILSFAGLFVFEGFIILSSLAYLVYGESVSSETLVQNWLSLSAGFINIIQAIVQTIFVIDGLQRCSISREDQKKKPGRGVVTFLLISNVAIWIFKTFQVKEIGLTTQAEYYGKTPWAIIMNLNLPLMLFYRFHSSVCLADIWASAYESEHNYMGVRMLQ